jgi:hypothetical protein
LRPSKTTTGNLCFLYLFKDIGGGREAKSYKHLILFYWWKTIKRIVTKLIREEAEASNSSAGNGKGLFLSTANLSGNFPSQCSNIFSHKPKTEQHVNSSFY